MAARTSRARASRASALQRIKTWLHVAERVADTGLELLARPEVVAALTSDEVEEVLLRVDGVLSKLAGLRTRLTARLPALASTGAAPESDTPGSLSAQPVQQDVVFRAVYVDLDVDDAIATHSAQTGVGRAEMFRMLLEAGIQQFSEGVGLPVREGVRQTRRTVELPTALDSALSELVAQTRVPKDKLCAQLTKLGAHAVLGVRPR